MNVLPQRYPRVVPGQILLRPMNASDESALIKKEKVMTEEMKNGTVDHPTVADIVNTPPGIRDVFGTVLETVTGGIAGATKGTGLAGVALLDAVTEVIKIAMRGAVGMGSDLVLGTKAMVLGIIRGTGEKGETALKILSHAAKIVIHHTADMSGDLA